MIHLVKHTSDGENWKFCYAESVKDEDDCLILSNVKTPIAEINKDGERCIKTINLDQCQINCKEECAVALAFRVTKPFWF